MTVRWTAPLLVSMLTLGAQVPGPWQVQPEVGHAQAPDPLPPVSYICPMDADVVESVAGRCPICKMELEPVRLDLAWSCPNHAAVITDAKGFCPVDRRELVQVAVSNYWTCAESGKTHLLEPGRCGSGQPRKLERNIRAHGDHNPRHGGQFFMASDKWHHLEGTYPRAGLFRVHFYDNFTKVLAAKGVSGRLTREDGGREAESMPLRLSRDGLTMEAPLAPRTVPTKEAPLTVTARLTFKPGDPEQRFDFTFTDLTKEPATAPKAPVRIQTAAGPTTVAPAAVAVAAPAAAALTPSVAVTPAAAATASAVTSAVPTLANCSPTMSRLDAVAFGQSLPRASSDLLRLLSMCSAEVETLIKDGQFGFVYQPSILSKDIVIALEETLAELPNRQRASVSAAIRRVVLAAWMLDLYGDQGNKEKLAESYETFAAAVADIKTAYGARP